MRTFYNIPANYDEIVIPEDYRKAESGRNFLLFQESFPTVPGGLINNHILAFGTKKFFKKLCAANCINIDGTFKACPTPFVQLTTICTYHDDNEDVYECTENNRLAPRIYFLLSGKSQQLYEKLFDLIIERAGAWNVIIQWLHSMADFEQSMYNAIGVKFPNVVRRGCHFHFCQAILRRILRHMQVI